MNNINERNFSEYMRELKALSADLDTVARNVVSKQASIGMRVSIRNTPVKSGVLRSGWSAIVAHDASPKVGFFRRIINALAHKKGKTWEAGYGNSVSYGLYVNDGHRQQVGRYVPAIGKRLVKPYVPGVHMLEKGIDAANRQTDSIFNEEIDKVKRRRRF